MKLLVLNNMASGFGSGPIYDFIRLVSEAGDEVTIRSLDPSCDFSSAVADAKSFDAVVVAGGDGTHSSVCYLLRGTHVPILPFPSGTANLMTQNLLFPEEPAALAKILREGRTMDFDMGELESGDTRLGFTMMAGCGYDALIMKSAHDSKEQLGPAAYFKAAFENANPPVSHFKLNIDGDEIEADGVGVLLINFSKIQFDISIGLANKPRDGKLDVVIMKTRNAWDLLLPLLGAVFDHSGAALQNSEQLAYYQGNVITVESSSILDAQFDGEVDQITAPFTARIIPQSMRLIVGEDALREFGE